VGYSYNRTAARDLVLPMKPTDAFRQIAKRMVLNAAAGKTVRLSPRTSPKYDDYAFWYDDEQKAFQAVLNGRPTADLNGDHLALKLVETWSEDLR
jgi:hypothetical protein